ncbi:hypothetical protein J0910_17685 [Nocardiopsis sp. CNT-189]|uniref:hypothetical protein n=1 Tax=Nocardiopsis oceanisediminis TaxID=2816862 RepID=UPI003B2E15C9
MTAPAIAPARGRDLIDPVLFDRLAADVCRDHGHPAELSERIVDQALAFLAACAGTAEPIGPSALVDLGWHAFILRTEAYRAFCERVADRMIDHCPIDPDATHASGAETHALLERSIAAVRATGLHYDPALWACAASCDDSDKGGPGSGTGNCSQCHQGCTDSTAK